MPAVPTAARRMLVWEAAAASSYTVTCTSPLLPCLCYPCPTQVLARAEDSRTEDAPIHIDAGQRRAVRTRAHGNVSSACPAYRALLTSGRLRLSPAIRMNRGVSETVVEFKESSAAAPTRVATPSFERPPPLYSRATRLGTAAHGVTLTRADRLPRECCWCRNARPGALLPPCVL